MNLQFNSIIELIKAFPDEKTCIKYLEQTRWNGKVISPFDEDSKVYKCKRGYKCKNTGKYFNVKTGTIFQDTKLPLQTWFVAIWLITSHSKGISSVQLAKDLKVMQKTAWFILHRIRTVFQDQDIDMSGEVEVDETYIGGKNKNRHKNKKIKYSQGRSYKDKTPVFGMIQRGGKLMAKVVPDVKGNTLKTIIYTHVDLGSVIHSDEWFAYVGLSREYDHRVIEHGKGIYGTENSNSNSIEGAWGILKRMIIGVYHYTSRKHMQRYVDEFVFRYNNRKIDPSVKFDIALRNINKRITYKQLTYEKAA